MKKLFKAIRHYDLEEVKKILDSNPDAICSVAVPPPKKDIGQSPLQVAIKISAFDIAEYLIEQGADVNFMEDECPGTSVRCPLLHDAIGLVFFCLCCHPFNTKEEINRHLDNTKQAFAIFKMLCDCGADVNKLASNGLNALNKCVHAAERVLDRQAAYHPVTQNEAEEYFVKMLDILIEHGANFAEWANSSHYPPVDEPGMMNKELFIDDFVPKETGDIDRTAHTRTVMKKYVEDRKLNV